MRTVLIVAYAYPPFPAVGGIRIAGLAKYLPHYGWEPIVLTRQYPGRQRDGVRVIETRHLDLLNTLGRKIKKTLRVNLEQSLGDQLHVLRKRPLTYETLLSLLRSLIAFPDEEVGWYPFAVRAGRRLVQDTRPDAMISSALPATGHLIARTIKAGSGIRWIADFRDPWTQNKHYPFGPVRRLLDTQLERTTLRAADALVTVSKPLAKELSLLHRRPVECIPNGFDPAEFNGHAGPPPPGKLTITYTGGLYSPESSPEPLLVAVSACIAQGLIEPSRIQIRFFGHSPSWLPEVIDRYRLRDVVTLYGSIERHQALRKQVESDILLVLTRHDATDSGTYTGKIFEYLGARRPILSIGYKDGVIGQLLGETGAGVHIPPSDHAALSRRLLSYYNEKLHTGSVSYHAEESEVRKYTQVEMARHFSELLEELSSSSRRPAARVISDGQVD